MPTKNNQCDLSELQSLGDSLMAEINALQHELRRITDGLERAGGSSHELEASARQLSKNIHRCEDELVANKKQQAQANKPQINSQ